MMSLLTDENILNIFITRIFSLFEPRLLFRRLIMPRGDRTGPGGLGPMTGRAAGYNVPGYMNPIPGRPGGGFWRGSQYGRGGGRGWRNMYWATGLPGWMRYQPGAYGSPYAPSVAAPYAPRPTAEMELNALEDQVKYMEEGIRAARERIEELEKERAEEGKDQ
jgi:hypothetical protein